MTQTQIASNVVRLRGSLSQKKLADLMRERGFNWVQSTVWSIEQGKRDLKLDEGVALADVLGVQIQELTEPPYETVGEKLLNREREKLYDDWQAAVSAITKLHERRLKYGSAVVATLTSEQANRVFSMYVELFNEQYEKLTINSCLTAVFSQDVRKSLPYEVREKEALERLGLVKVSEFDELPKTTWANPWQKVLQRINELEN